MDLAIHLLNDWGKRMMTTKTRKKRSRFDFKFFFFFFFFVRLYYAQLYNIYKIISISEPTYMYFNGSNINKKNP